MINDFLKENDIRFLEQESLKRHTTFKVGGKAVTMALPDTVEKLSRLLKYINSKGINYYILGNGSNLIFSDEGFDGVVIKTSELKERRIIDEETIYARAGCNLSSVCLWAAELSLEGFERLYGIPGSIGGAVFMNAGAFNGEINDWLVSVDCLDEDGNLHTLTKNECMFGYRDSVFRHEKLVVVGATFRMKKGDRQEITDFMNDLLQRRKDRQPLDMPSAGSSFKRPEGYYAADLIDQCGLKGMSVGGRQVSTKHAGFIVNTGDATCSDIIMLADRVSRIVKEKTGVTLEKEMIIVR
jgi:UDP-N-acetylmuramate dehydrogenase